jgi:hypothetical protein
MNEEQLDLCAETVLSFYALKISELTLVFKEIVSEWKVYGHLSISDIY